MYGSGQPQPPGPGVAVARDQSSPRAGQLRVVLAVGGVGLIALARPGLLGEHLATVASAAAIGLAAAQVAVSRRSPNLERPAVALLIGLFMAETWSAFRSQYSGGSAGDVLRGAVEMCVTVAAFAVLASDERLLRTIQAIFVVLCASLSASSIVTDILELVHLQLPLIAIPLTPGVTGNVYFPLTPTAGQLLVGGDYLPRFTGLGREPGWMAMFCGVAIFLALAIPTTTMGQRVTRVFCVLFCVGGVLTAISTAGFAVVVFSLVIFAFATIAARSHGIKLLYQLGIAVPLALALVAVSLYAPIVGLLAKSDTNAASLNERNQATSSGLNALASASLGGPQGGRISGVNLIAVATSNGWPYTAALTFTLILVIALARPSPYRLAGASVVFLTFLSAQPPQGSTSAYIVLLLVLAGPGRDPTTS